MKKKSLYLILQKSWFFLLICSYLSLNYYFFGGWWNSSLGTIFILFFSYLIWKNDFLKVAGIHFKLKTALITLASALFLTSASYLIIRFIAQKNNISILVSNWENYYHDIFYVLNEEIILGAFFLYFLVEKKKLPPLLASVGLAVAFSFIHFIFYKWIFIESGTIKITTLATLFLVGFVRNNLILQTGNIGYSWALHFGWMSMMFGNHYFYTETNQRLTEPERFNLFLGSNEMLIIAFFLALISFIFFKKRKTIQK